MSNHLPDNLPIERRWAVGALLLLTVVTGLIDAVSFLKLGHVFVANMTGNVVFLGFALNSESGFMVIAPVVATAGFLGGSALGGRVAAFLGDRPRIWLGATFAAQALVLAVAAGLVGVGAITADDQGSHALVAILAACFGLQNATVRRLAPRDLNTTVLTMTLTGLAADSVLGGNAGAKQRRRLGSIAAMFTGAACGALLLETTTAGVIGVAAAGVAAVAVVFGFAKAEPAAA